MKGNTALLIIILLALGGSLYLSYTNFQQIQLLRQENTTLWVKLDSVQQIVNKKPVKQKAAPATQSTGSPFLDLLIQMGEESEREAAKSISKPRLVITFAIIVTYIFSVKCILGTKLTFFSISNLKYRQE